MTESSNEDEWADAAAGWDDDEVVRAYAAAAFGSLVDWLGGAEQLRGEVRVGFELTMGDIVARPLMATAAKGGAKWEGARRPRLRRCARRLELLADARNSREGRGIVREKAPGGGIPGAFSDKLIRCSAVVSS